MKAIILAAGMGKRTRNYGEEKPKCLFQFQGKTTLEHQLTALKESNVKDVVMVIGYKKEMILDFIRSHPLSKEMNIAFVENPNYQTTNTSYSWWLARDFVKDEPVIHFNSDLIFFPDLIRELLDSPKENIVVIDPKVELNDSMEQVILDQNNKILHMDKANVTGAQAKGTGVSKFSKQATNFMINKLNDFIVNKNDTGQNFYGMIRLAVKELDFHGLDRSPFFFREYNSAEDYDVAIDAYNKLQKPQTKIKALILAAGKERRLKHYIQNKPTYLLEYKQKPIIVYQLQSLIANGINDIIIIIGYKGHMIKDYIKNHSELSKLKITYIENDEYLETNTAYSWWLAKDFIKDQQEILHLHSDLIFHEELIKKILNNERENIIYIDKKIPLDESMEQVVLDENNKILYMDKRNVPEAHGKAVGVAKFSNESINYLLNRIEKYISIGDKRQALYGLIRDAITEIPFRGIEIGNSFFKEINTVEDYRDILKQLLPGESKMKLPKKTSVIMMYGLPATGKTTTSRKIRDYFERLMSVEVLSTFKIREELGLTDLYSEEQRNKVYDELAKILEEKIKRGIYRCIILDGNFNKKERRQKIYDMTHKHNCDFYIVKCSVDNNSEVDKRLQERSKSPLSFVEHRATSQALRQMIDKTGDSIEDDDFPNTEPTLINFNTEKNDITIEPKKPFIRGIIDALGK